MANRACGLITWRFKMSIEFDVGASHDKQPTVASPIKPVVSSAFCKECGGFVKYDKSCALMSSPPQYKGNCKDCGKIHYTDCYKVD